MLDEIVDLLACPHCGSVLVRVGSQLRCEAGHTHDIARAGYVSLLAGDAHVGTADDAAMVDAREAFLASRHYGPIADGLVRAVVPRLPGEGAVIVDVGAGTGYYLGRLLDERPSARGVALDLSKHAVRRAVRSHPHIGGVVCDAWRGLPVRDGVASVVTCVFAPRNPSEFARVIAPGGILACVVPTQRHLQEAIEALGMIGIEADKEERLSRGLAPYFERESSEVIEGLMTLNPGGLTLIAGMGPSARHLGAAEIAARAERTGTTVVSLSVSLSVWRRLSADAGNQAG